MTKHESVCEAPICQDSQSNDLVWYAGEKICLKSPYQRFQVKQNIINRELKKGSFKQLETPYTTLDLKIRSI